MTVTEVPLMWGKLIIGEAMYVCVEGAGNMWTSLYLILNFTVNQKLHSKSLEKTLTPRLSLTNLLHF